MAALCLPVFVVAFRIRNRFMGRVQENIRPTISTIGGSRPPQNPSPRARITTRPKAAVKDRKPYHIPPFALASVFLACLLLLSFHPRVQVNPRLAESVWASAALLLLLICAVWSFTTRNGRKLTYAFVPIKVHYVQLMMHSSIYLYWGWYWPHVYHAWPLILIQLLFTYVFDMCLCWLRRDHWIFGLGVFPIVLSTNLFLSFRDDWFYLQFAMLCIAMLCKEFIKWTRNNRRTHIFNPSGIALCITSLALIVTKATYITWGEAIANTLRRPPHIYLELFLLGLVVQALFSVTGVTLRSCGLVRAEPCIHGHDRSVLLFRQWNFSVFVLGTSLTYYGPRNLTANGCRKTHFRESLWSECFCHIWTAGIGRRSAILRQAFVRASFEPIGPLD